MSIVFFGTAEFSLPSFKALISSKEEVRLVVTQPAKQKGRGRILSQPPIKDLADQYSIPVVQPQRIKDELFINKLRALSPEFIVVVAYGKILPKEILATPTRGCINIHASLLPKYRGAAPIQWALMKGESVTGITSILMNEELDSGDILLQRSLGIEDSDNSASLSLKLSELGAIVLIETIEGLRKGVIKPIPQTGEASYAPSLRKEDGKIDWNKSALELFNFIRAMYPWPSAYTFFGNERVKIIKAKPLEGRGISGRIEKASNSKLIIGTGQGLLLIEELQPEGKKVMKASSFLAGRKLKEGNDFFT